MNKPLLYDGTTAQEQVTELEKLLSACQQEKIRNTRKSLSITE